MSGSDDKLQQLIDDLDKSIATFDERFSNLPEEVPPARMSHVGAHDFPEIDPDARRSLAAGPNVNCIPDVEAPMTPLLSELAASAGQHAEHVRHELARRRHAAEQISDRLRLLFGYLHRLTQHLNLLKPELQVDYAIDSQHRFENIRWQDSSLRGETGSPSERSLTEKLTLRVRFTCKPQSLVVADAVMKRQEGDLYLMNLLWHDAGVVDMGKHQKGHRIEIDGCIPLQLVFSADVDRECIVLRCRNLLGLGLSAFTIAPAAIDDAVLDTLGQCLIGRSRQLPGCFVPTPFNTPESAA